MSRLNYLSSPMHLFKEDLNDTDAIRNQKIQSIKNEKLKKSPFTIGSVKELDEKVQHLENQINGLLPTTEYELSDDDIVDDLSTDSKIKSDMMRFKDKKEMDRFAGVFSIVSAVSFNKPTRIKKIAKVSLDSDKITDDKSDKKSMGRFIELCKYPEMKGSKVPDLANKITVEFIVKRVLKAQKVSYMKSYEIKLKKWIFCKEIETLIKSLFWFFFIGKYGTEFNKSDLPKLFRSAAIQYGNFLTNILEETPYFSDKFQLQLPNLISQTVYAAISECFHDSLSQFNEAFIEDIIGLVFFWILGIRPSKGLWKSWNMHGLKPTEQIKKEISIREQEKIVQKMLDPDISKKEVIKSEVKQEKPTESLTIGPDTGSRIVLLNMNGTSPLIQLYMTINQINYNKGTNYLVKHPDFYPIISDETQPTYQDVIKSSLDCLQNRMESYKRFQEDCHKDMQQFIRQKKLKEQNEEEKVEKLLRHTRETHRLSNMIVKELFKDKDSVSFRVDEQVQKSLSRLD